MIRVSKKAATIGDIGTDHDGYAPSKIITGSPDVLIDGKPVARVSDQLEPHTKPGSSPHPRTIASGSSTVFINGLPMAITGGSVGCGGVIIGSSTVVVGDMAPAARQMSIPAPLQQATPTSQPGIIPVLDDWKPVPGYRGLIYHTKRQMDDYQADDLQHGDLAMQDIIKLGKTYNFAFVPQEFYYPASLHFQRLRIGAAIVSWGKYSPIIGKMIDRFQSNTGGLFTDPLLDKAMKEHSRTAAFTTELKRSIQSELAGNNGSLPKSIKANTMQKINSAAIGVSLPKFDDRNDRTNGLGIAVHDVYAVEAALTSLEFKGRQFRGEITYRIQDHFGLDVLDVDGGKGFEFLAPFRSWFLLQRYTGYNYAPFITEMNFNVFIEGSF